MENPEHRVVYTDVQLALFSLCSPGPKAQEAVLLASRVGIPKSFNLKQTIVYRHSREINLI